MMGYRNRKVQSSMKKMWNSFKNAFSMYSKIPMPQSEWTDENMSLRCVFFPWVGAVIGLASMGCLSGRRLAG